MLCTRSAYVPLYICNWKVVIAAAIWTGYRLWVPYSDATAHGICQWQCRLQWWKTIQSEPNQNARVNETHILLMFYQPLCSIVIIIFVFSIWPEEIRCISNNNWATEQRTKWGACFDSFMQTKCKMMSIFQTNERNVCLEEKKNVLNLKLVDFVWNSHHFYGNNGQNDLSIFHQKKYSFFNGIFAEKLTLVCFRFNFHIEISHRQSTYAFPFTKFQFHRSSFVTKAQFYKNLSIKPEPRFALSQVCRW